MNRIEQTARIVTAALARGQTTSVDDLQALIKSVHASLPEAGVVVKPLARIEPENDESGTQEVIEADDAPQPRKSFTEAMAESKRHLGG